jgi:large subunit ribosomal protein L17
MRHRKSRGQLNRFTSWRKATLISLAKNIIVYQSIKTTKTKAQIAKPLIEKLISLAKQNTLASKRQAYKILGSHRLVKLLFDDIAPRFNNRIGGYTRVFNLGRRRGDNANMAILELVEIKKKEKRLPKEEKEIKAEEKHIEEKKPTRPEVKVLEKPTLAKKPSKKFLGGLRSIFKKQRDSL